MGKRENITIYGGLVRLEFDPDKHVYHVRVQGEDGKMGAPRWVPSVTGITGMLDDGKSGGLMGWATKCMMEEILERAEFYYADDDVELDEVTLPPLVRGARFAHKKQMDKAAQLGTVVHNYIEAHINHKLGLGDEPRRPKHKKVQSGIDAFMAYERTKEIEYVFTERRIYSLEHHYAGTLDILARIGGELTVLDIKTSNRVYLVHKLQAAAYVQALNEEFEEQVKNRVILHLSKVGGVFTPHDLNEEARFDSGTQENDMKGFLGLRAAYRRVKEVK